MRLVRISAEWYLTSDGRYEVRLSRRGWVVSVAGSHDAIGVEASTKREAVSRLAKIIVSDATSH